MRSRLPTLMAASLAAVLCLAAQATPVHAENILNFGLNNQLTITATENAGDTATTIATTNGSVGELVGITLLNGATQSPSIVAYLVLSATSTNSASNNSGFISQNYTGSFSITAGQNGTGTNYLSGTFTGMTFGFSSGAGANLTSADPPASITLSSDVISDLSSPSAAGFTFTNVTPGLQVVGNSIQGFTASGSGSFSASPSTVSTVPEPSSVVLAGIGGLGLIGYGLRRRKALGA